MRKREFINRLKRATNDFSYSEQKDILDYYSELIEDRIENGQREDDAVASLGSIDIIIDDILEGHKNNQSEEVEPTLYSKRSKKRKTKIRSMSVAGIILLIILSPLILSLFVAVVSLIIGLGAAAISLVAYGVYYFIGSFVFMTEDLFVGLIQCGASLIIFAIGLVLVRYGIKGLIFLIKKFINMLRNTLFSQREISYE